MSLFTYLPAIFERAQWSRFSQSRTGNKWQNKGLNKSYATNSTTATHTCEKSRNPYSSQGSMSSTRTVVHVPSLQSRTWYAPSWHMVLVIITRSTNSGRSASTARALKNLPNTAARVRFDKSHTSTFQSNSEWTTGAEINTHHQNTPKTITGCHMH